MSAPRVVHRPLPDGLLRAYDASGKVGAHARRHGITYVYVPNSLTVIDNGPDMTQGPLVRIYERLDQAPVRLLAELEALTWHPAKRG